MKITCNHPSSSYGVPVILGDDNQPMNYPDGLKEALRRIGWKRRRFAEECGVQPRSLEKYFLAKGPLPTAKMLNILAANLPSGLD